MPPFDPPAAQLPDEMGPRYCEVCGVREWVFCAGLTDDEAVHHFRRLMSHQRVVEGCTLFREGDVGTHVFTITAGYVKLYKLLPDGRRQVTNFLYPGDVFGLPVEGVHPCTAEAISAAHLCRFPRRDLFALFEQAPALQQQLFARLVRGMAEAQEQMLLLGRKTAREKVASFLLRQVERAESVGLPSRPLMLPMGRGDIADHLGLTIETVSRTLTRLKRDGVVELGRAGQVVVVEGERLADMAAGG